MAIGIIVMLINVVMTTVKNVRVGNDPWGDGRTLEWAIPSPPPFYNFAQTPLVRGLDTYWIEKMEGNKEGMVYAEPLGDVHMPNGSIIPLIMSFGMFVAAFGALYFLDDTKPWALAVLIIGLGITFGSMLVRSLKDDLGFHITKEELIEDAKRGGNTDGLK